MPVKDTISLYQGFNGNWYIKKNNKIIAGFFEEAHCILFYELLSGVTSAEDSKIKREPDEFIFTDEDFKF